MTDETIAPIEVTDTPLADQIWSAVRQIAPAIMAFLIGRKLIADDLAIMLGVAGGVLWPVVASQIKTRQRSKLIARLANAAPDSVAVLK